MYRLLAPLATVLVWLVARLRVRGAEHLPRRGPVLVAANHVSRADPLIIAVVLHRLGRRSRFLAVSGLFEQRILGWVLRKTRMIPVTRGAGPERMTADAKVALDAGQAVVVYPEGTIPPPGTKPSGRAGAGLLALEAGVPVVPVATRGLDMPDGRPRGPRRRRVTVAFGPPMDLSAWGDRRDRTAQLEVSQALLATSRSFLPPTEGAER